MENTKNLLRDYLLLSSLKIKRKQKNERKHETTKTLNKINLLPATYGEEKVYIDETKKETTGGRESKIQVMYY